MINRVVQVENVISRHIGDDIVVIKDDGLATHVLNKTAAFIWEKCDGQHGVGEIVAQICERFDVSVEEVTADVAEIIEQFLKVEIVKQVEEITL
jgi:hypothetical protein